MQGLEPVREGAFAGHLWARPSVKGLQEILKQIFENPNEAKRVAKVMLSETLWMICMLRDFVLWQVGMEEVRKLYNPDAVAQVVMHRLRSIERILDQRAVRAEL